MFALLFGSGGKIQGKVAVEAHANQGARGQRRLTTARNKDCCYDAAGGRGNTSGGCAGRHSARSGRHGHAYDRSPLLQ